MVFTAKRVDVASGVWLEYVEHGRRGGVPVLMLHGVTDSWRSFEPVLPHLPDSVHAFAVSQRGHGDSSKPEDGYTPAHFAADVDAFLDAVDVEAAVVVGHSMGSFVAQRVALNYPERTLGLVLMGSFSKAHDNGMVVEFWEQCVSPLEDPVDPEIARGFQLDTLASPIPDDLLEAFIAESLKVPARVWRAAFEGMLDADHSKLLARVEAPTLVVWGDRDAFFPRSEQDLIASVVPRASLAVYEGAGHALHWEHPERFAADLAAFCERFAD